jgi:hypothetical protein
MKKIIINENKIFEIAKIIKNFLPNTKIRLSFTDKKIIIYLPQKIDRLKLEELRTFFQLKYPNYNFVFYFNI